MITRKELIRQLEKFKIAKGRPVMVHSSLRAVGEVDGGGEALLETLIEYFTEDGGLLCVPTHTWDDKILDMRETYTHLGAFPSIAAAHPDGVRTVHPTHSMVVFGEETRVKTFVSGEEKVSSPVDPNGCHGKLYREDGYVLLVGVGLKSCTFLHCAEEMIGMPNRVEDSMVERQYIDKSGNVIKRLMHPHSDWGMSHIDYNKLEPAFRYHGCIADGLVGEAETGLCSARKMKDVLELMYKKSGYTDFVADGKPLEESLYK